ncbi:MAG: hypothetical protein WBB25_10265 [Sulfitobacter sp.]
MQLVLQTGTHYTEQDRLVQSLLRNGDNLQAQNVSMPDPESYRGLLRDTLNAMGRADLGEDARDVLLDAILPEGEPDRLILTDPNFFRTAGTAIQRGKLYPAAAQRMAYMAQLFEEDDLHIYMAIRNPAAILPIFKSVSTHPADKEFWGGRDARDVRWSDTIAEIRELAPEIPITLWCNEDMPLIWSQVIREIAGLELDSKIAGGFDLLTTIMSKEGMQRFRAYLASHSEMSEMQKRRVIAAFLDKFAIEEEIEEELDMPGWTDELVEELTEIYDQDLAVIQDIPGVRVISP